MSGDRKVHRDSESDVTTAPFARQEDTSGVIRGQPSPESQVSGKGGAGGAGAYITRLRRRRVDTYAVTEDELTSIDTQHWQTTALFSASSLAMGGLLSTLLTWESNENSALPGVLLLAALAFGGFGFWVHRTRRTLLKKIKDQTLPHGE